MKKASLLTLMAAAAVMVMAAMTAAAATPSPSETARALLQQRVVNALTKVDGLAGNTPAAGRQTRGLGQVALEQTNADVWSHGDFAYVGTWSLPCSGIGVKIVDVSDPTQPALVATAAAYPGTSAEDMEVLSVDTPAVTGDLLAVGIQQC